jgi:DNA-binding response OmpR family regulator
MKKILLIDDDPGILEALTLILEGEGYEIETIIKVSKDINRKLKKFHPDLILLDMLLSGLDGRDIAKNLKANPKYKKIPIIMLSAHPNAKREAMACGANYFIAKPFDMNELIALVKKAI